MTEVPSPSMRGKSGRFSLIGAFNGHTERLMTTLIGALTASIGIGTLMDLWSKEIGGALSAASGAWVMFVAELIRARLAMLARLKMNYPRIDADLLADADARADERIVDAQTVRANE